MAIVRSAWACAALFVCIATAAAQEQPPIQQKGPFVFTKADQEFLVKSSQMDRYFEEKGFVFSDRETTEYLNSVGQAVLPEGPAPENVVWRFRVLRDPMPNAFALANGSIYIHSGLLATLENEAQLASVLAHEVTHVLNRHGYLENRGYRKKMVAIHILMAAGSAAGAAGGTAGNITSAIANMIPSMVVATIYGYSREHERDADTRAVLSLVEADYSAEEMINTFRLLQKSHEVQLEGEPVFYRSHPKLRERIAYTTDLVNANRPRTRHPKVEAERYGVFVERVARHNVGLDILGGRARTALAVARRLVTLNSKSSDNFHTLGEAWRALGPRTPEPTPEEVSSHGKKQTRKMVGKMTFQEYEDGLMATPEGKTAWEASRKEAEEAYRKALELDPANAKAHRGLGFLYERARLAPQCVEEFRKYLELSPGAPDRLQITRRLEAMEEQIVKQATVPPAP